MFIRVVVFVALLWPTSLRGQANLFTDEGRRDFAQIRDYVIRTAEKIPESKYSLRPVPEVRIFAHGWHLSMTRRCDVW